MWEGGNSPWICAAGPPGSGVNWVGVHMDGVSALLGFNVLAPAVLLLSPPLCDHTTAQVRGVEREIEQKNQAT